MRILEKVLVQAAIAKCQTGWLKCHLFCTLLKVGKFKFKMLADVVLGKSLLPGLQCVSVYDRGRKEFFYVPSHKGTDSIPAAPTSGFCLNLITSQVLTSNPIYTHDINLRGHNSAHGREVHWWKERVVNIRCPFFKI